MAQTRQKLSGTAYDLVILDLHLGDGLGTELLPDLKRLQPDAVVVMMSGSEPPPSPGVSLYLPKSTSPEVILRRLAQVVREWRP